MPEPVSTALTRQQLDDLVLLLSQPQYVTRGNIERFGSLALGSDITKEAGNEIADTDAFVKRVVEVLSAKNKLWDLITKLKEQSHRNSDFAVRLESVLQGGRLADDQLQALVRDVQPFFMAATLPQIQSALCAIGLGNPKNSLVGSGFLVGPDLVMTNYHVLKNFLAVDPANKEIVENASGDQIFCFFDYTAPPAPDVPPIAGRPQRYMTVKARTEGWLFRARVDVANDGKDDVEVLHNEYDYVIFQLERDVGTAPARLSGGQPRGWMSLPKEIDPLPNRRLMLFQHPEGAPQAFDIGEFDSLDRSETRVRYHLSSDRGSSGSPALDPNGGLFALHNAAVMVALGGKKLNQGVRIDHIAKDLATVPKWSAVAPAALAPANRSFWSLNDDLNAPRPIIGRKRFVEHLIAMLAGEPERVLAVSGPDKSGRHFSIDLLQRYLGPSVPVALFSPKELSELEPEPFLRVLMDQLGVREGVRLHPVAIPQSNPNEGLPRWLGIDLPRWLSDRLSADAAKNPARFPAWMVVDLIVPDGQTLRWAKNLRDFLVGLAGVRDAGQQSVDVPQLRWLVLGSTPDALALTGVKRREEDLNVWPSPYDDFAECMQLAWQSIGRRAELDPLLLQRFATIFETNAQRSNISRRQVLADAVVALVTGKPGQ